MSIDLSCSFAQFQTDMCLSVIDSTTVGLLFELLLFLIAFVGLALSAEHLCNSMETLCDHWGISEDVGGATFIALGGAIPEITINCISTYKSAGSTSVMNASIADLGVGAILGSGMIAYLLIPSLSSLFAGNEKLLIRQHALFRDASFYSLAVIVLMSALFFGIGNWHAPILIFVYISYVLSLVYSHRLNVWWSRSVVNPHLGPIRSGSATPQQTSPSIFREKYASVDEEVSIVVPLLPLSSSELFLERASEQRDQQKMPVGNSVCTSLYNVCRALIRPMESLINQTCPDCRIFKPNEHLYPLTFVTSFGWITFFSFLITIIVQRWVELLAMPSLSAIFGLVLVAAGAEVPDTVNAITIARRGFGGMSTSACLGSQVVNICLGLGMPWLIASIAGKIIPLSPTNSFIHEASVLVLIDVLLLVIIVSAFGPYHRDGRSEVNKAKAFCLIVWYTVTVSYLAYATVTAHIGS